MFEQASTKVWSKIEALDSTIWQLRAAHVAEDDYMLALYKEKKFKIWSLYKLLNKFSDDDSDFEYPYSPGDDNGRIAWDNIYS